MNVAAKVHLDLKKFYDEYTYRAGKVFEKTRVTAKYSSFFSNKTYSQKGADFPVQRPNGFFYFEA